MVNCAASTRRLKREDQPVALVAANLIKTYSSGRGAGRAIKRAVDDVSIKVEPGDFVAVVGESGSGKSTSARILLDLIRPDSGTVTWEGADVVAMSPQDKKRFRSKVQAIFQDPSGSLNPRKRIRTILGEVIKFYNIARTAEAVEDAALHSLRLVGLDPPQIYLDRFPHELSGGQRQRVLIARSMIPDPSIIIADEAVSALDVSVKAGVLRLMEDLRREKGVGYLLISHDLPVVRKVARYVYVMQNGRVVEDGPTEEIFERPKADYTRSLLEAALDLDTVLEQRQRDLGPVVQEAR
jgi:ABC-type glutathione transport system ATPase component